MYYLWLVVVSCKNDKHSKTLQDTTRIEPHNQYGIFQVDSSVENLNKWRGKSWLGGGERGSYLPPSSRTFYQFPPLYLGSSSRLLCNLGKLFPVPPPWNPAYCPLFSLFPDLSPPLSPSTKSFYSTLRWLVRCWQDTSWGLASELQLSEETVSTRPYQSKTEKLSFHRNYCNCLIDN